MKKIFVTITFIIIIAFASLYYYNTRTKEPKATKIRSDLALEPAKASPEPAAVFIDKVRNVEIVEIGSDNIALWAKNGIRDATLILVDANLEITSSIPDAQIAEAKQLIQNNNYDLLETYTGITTKFKRLYAPYNYLYAAHRLGLIKKIIWVLPVYESIKEDYLDFFKEKLRSNPGFNYPKEDIDSFTYSDNKLEGTLLGVPVTVVHITDLQEQRDPVIISISLSYFPAFIVDNVKTPIEDIVVNFLLALQKVPLISQYITIVNANRTLKISMQFRFLSNILKTIFSEPSHMQAPKKAWLLKQEADKNLFFIEYDNAVSIYNKILTLTPDDPAIYYQLATISLKRSDYEEASGYLEEAIKRDKYYVLAYVDLLSHLQYEDLKLKFLSFAYKNHSDDIPILTTMANLYYKKGQFQESLDAYLKLISLGIEAYDLNFYVADCYYNLKKYEKAKEVYENTFSLLSQDEKRFYSFYYLNLA